MDMEAKVEELARSLDDIHRRLKGLEDQVQEMRQPGFVVMEDGRKESWEVVEIEKVMKKWYNAVKEPVIVSASRDENGGWVNTCAMRALPGLPMDKVMFLMGPFSNEQRLKLLLQLREYPKSSTDLSNATGLQGGQLYHHLDELIRANYVEKIYKGKYKLTDVGEWAFYNVLHTAFHLLRFMEVKGPESEGERGEVPDSDAATKNGQEDGDG